MTGKGQSDKLSAVLVKQAKSKDKPYKLADGKGLNLLINPNGSKYWRLSYRFHQKQKTLALGVYPDVSLSEARELAQKAIKSIREGVDPSHEKKLSKSIQADFSFVSIAKEWHKKESGRWSEGHASSVWRTIEADAVPFLGDMRITDIKTRDVLHVVKCVEERGALDVAGRVKQRIEAIFRYAIQVGYADYNPVQELKNVIQARKVQHRKSVDIGQLPKFLNALDEYKGYLITRYALQFLVYTFVRPGELRSAEWKEFDLDNAIWRIPAAKMKMKEEHIVPLSEQAVQILSAVNEITGGYDFVFPGAHNFRKPMSENTLTYAIRKRLEFDATAHGFRTTASTILNEVGFRVDVIERQLAHGERNKVRAAYNRAQYLEERKQMMQWYSDYIDQIKNGADVVSIGQRR
jgi:integrase